MPRTSYHIIKKPLVTEKTSVAMQDDNTYTFIVDRLANKVQIRQAVEELFNVKVQSVRTLIRKGKPRRVRQQWTHMSDTKQAIVKLHPDHKLDIV